MYEQLEEYRLATHAYFDSMKELPPGDTGLIWIRVWTKSLCGFCPYVDQDVGL